MRSAAPPPTAADARAGGVSDDLLRGLRWRSIGPYRGGRSVAVAGLRDQPYVYYFGGTGGGIWKTTDGGIRWANVSDGQLGTGSVGAVAVAESDANVVYAGMGEGCIRGNVSHGDGVYRSTDGGRTWTSVGLRDTRQIGRIRVHPGRGHRLRGALATPSDAPGRGCFARRTAGAPRRSSVDDDGRHRHRHGSDQPARAVCRLLAGGAHALSLESGGQSGLYKTTDGGAPGRRWRAGAADRGLGPRG